MKKLWSIFYNIIFLPTLFLILQILGFFNQKVKKGIVGRKRVFEELIIATRQLNSDRKTVWFHSASLGEFEQAKPIIEKLKEEQNVNIIITFFSPSGYENSRKYPYADLISYLPFDTITNADKFVRIVKPDLAIMMRYDIWPNIIYKLREFNIPSFIVDATMRKDSMRTLPFLRSFHKALFSNMSKFLTVSESDAEGFKLFNCGNEKIKTVGDTRFDRVLQKSIQARDKKLINQYVIQNKKVFVAGSTWEQDEAVILPAFAKLAKFDKDTMLIIAPHEPNLLHLETIENEFAGVLKTIRFSHLNNYSDERVIIVDSIGILLTLYTYAKVAFVGGSFKQNVHNVLEAAVYGIPVIFGPRIEHSQEAKRLHERGGGIMIYGKREAYRRLRTLFTDPELRQRKGQLSLEYVQENAGATEKILEEIIKVI
jgi:3-deoxy-D-manno-octulosonic-acid transferase